MSYRIAGLAGVVAAVAMWVAPGLAAEAPVAVVVTYEVAESLTFKSSPTGERRVANATLLGKKIIPFTTDPTSPWATAQFMSALAQSNIPLATGIGPVYGTFDLLHDVDPTRESLDTLVVSASGAVSGVLDLTTSELGFAKISGTWTIKKSKGTFAGVLVVPFPYGPGYAYVDLTHELHLDALGVSMCDSSNAVVLPGGAPGCLLGSDEFALGIPLTKAVLILSGE